MEGKPWDNCPLNGDGTKKRKKGSKKAKKEVAK